MCQMCDDPKLTLADLRAQMFAIIEECGWMIQYVESEPGHEGFGYTVGLTVWNLPELYVEGLDAQQTASLLNAAARELIDSDLGPCDTFEGPDGRVYLLGLRLDVTDLLTALDAFGTSVGALELSPL